jgi:hypothetical protein
VVGREWVLVLRDTRPFQACFVRLADIHVPITKPALRHPLTEPFVAFAFSDDLGPHFKTWVVAAGQVIVVGWIAEPSGWHRQRRFVHAGP